MNNILDRRYAADTLGGDGTGRTGRYYQARGGSASGVSLALPQGGLATLRLSIRVSITDPLPGAADPVLGRSPRLALARLSSAASSPASSQGVGSWTMTRSTGGDRRPSVAETGASRTLMFP